jgi:hypothetical protein
MTLNRVAAVATARRNVVDRIDRFLRGLESLQRQPTRIELFWLRRALVHLREEQYREGEDAMNRAERAVAVPEHAADDSNVSSNTPAESLRSEFVQIVQGCAV